MLTITALNAHGKGGKGAAPVLAYLKATEYYRDADDQAVSSSRWWGKGAASLGLSGTVDEKAMEALANGYAPDGRPLCQNAGAKPLWVPQKDAQGRVKLDAKGNERGRWEGGHRVGWDLTLSAEKSFSVLYASASPEERERLLDAHRRAVDDALSFVERRAETRRGKAGRDVIGANLVASCHTHFGSRDRAPQVHTHCLVYAVAQGEDGQWGALSPEEMYRQKMTVGALYRASLAANLRGLGYGIEKRPEVDAEGQETGRAYFRVAGIGDELRDAFSKRRAAIVEHMARHGGSAQAACLATRKHKDEPTYAELVRTWTDALAQMRADDPTLFRDAAELRGRPSVTAGVVDDAKVLEALHANEAVFTRSQLVERLALEHVGRLDAAGVEREADAFLRRNDVVAVAADDIHADDRGQTLALRHREDRYAARWMIDLEQSVADRAALRKNDAGVRVEKSVVDEAVARYEREKGFSLTAEQRKAVDWVTQGTGGVAALSGMAGTGKTATAGAWIAAFKADGRGIIGAAVGWDAAKKLEAESGIHSFSTQSLIGQLDRGKLILSPKAVIVLDEAGMAGTHTVARLQQHCDRVGAKLVLQGDALQLQAVDAGAPFRLAIAAIGETQLTEIRRQQNRGDRQTAEAFYSADGSVRSRADSRRLGLGVLHRLEKAGQIEAYASQNDALEGLVQDHVNSPTPDRDKLVLGGTRADVAALNRAIRDEMKRCGRLGTEEHTFRAVERGVACDLTIAVGDRLRFGKKDRHLNVVNGHTGVVERFDHTADGTVRVVVRLESEVKQDEGRHVSVDPAAYAHLSLGYASTVHKAQGQGKEEVRQLANLGMTDRQLALVAFTRTKRTFALYGADDDIDPRVLAERIGTDRLKTNATEARKRRVREKVPVPGEFVRGDAAFDDPTSEHRTILRRAADLWQQMMNRFRLVPSYPRNERVLSPKPTRIA